MATPAAPHMLDAGALFPPRPGEITQAPTSRQMLADRVFRAICLAFACLTVLLVTFIVLQIAFSAAHSALPRRSS